MDMDTGILKSAARVISCLVLSFLRNKPHVFKSGLKSLIKCS